MGSHWEWLVTHLCWKTTDVNAGQTEVEAAWRMFFLLKMPASLYKCVLWRWHLRIHCPWCGEGKGVIPIRKQKYGSHIKKKVRGSHQEKNGDSIAQPCWEKQEQRLRGQCGQWRTAGSTIDQEAYRLLQLSYQEYCQWYRGNGRGRHGCISPCELFWPRPAPWASPHCTRLLVCIQ